MESKGIKMTITREGDNISEEEDKAETLMWCKEHGVELISFDARTGKTVITWNNSDFTSLTFKQIQGRLKLLDKLATRYEKEWRFK